MSLTHTGMRFTRALILGFAVAVTYAACASGPVDPELLRPTTTASATELTRITNDPLPEFWPQPSPDGSMLLFNQRDDAKYGSDRFAVIRTNVGSPGRTLVTDEASSYTSWFPNNQHFAYQTSRTGPLRVVRSVAAGGGGGMTFLTGSTTGAGEYLPDVSPDGDKVAFVTQMRGDTVMAMVESGSSNVTVYGPGLYPRWSPDGTRLAYQWRDRGTWQIFIMDLEQAAQVTQLTSGEANNITPDWSPDGEHLTFISDRDGSEHVYYVRADGTGVTQLTMGESTEQGPAWSSDGYIYFSSTRGSSRGDLQQILIDAESLGEAENYDIWRLKPVITAGF